MKTNEFLGAILPIVISPEAIPVWMDAKWQESPYQKGLTVMLARLARCEEGDSWLFHDSYHMIGICLKIRGFWDRDRIERSILVVTSVRCTQGIALGQCVPLSLALH